MPKQKRGKSKQDYRTPSHFLQAVKNKFKLVRFDVDLATSGKRNSVAPVYVTEKQNSLSLDWFEEFPQEQMWLNPPFGHIRPWAKACSQFSGVFGGRIFLLTPASVGANWFEDYVFENADIYFLNGRIHFVGEKDAYPKDCMLSVFGDVEPDISIWRWKKDVH